MKNENLKEKVNAENAELTDEQLAQVSGGTDDGGCGKKADDGKKNPKNPINNPF